MAGVVKRRWYLLARQCEAERVVGCRGQLHAHIADQGVAVLADVDARHAPDAGVLQAAAGPLGAAPQVLQAQPENHAVRHLARQFQRFRSLRGDVHRHRRGTHWV